jgi:signal peptidase I
VIWVLVGAAVLIGGLGWLRLSWLVITVQGPSMRPTLQPGDRLLVRRQSARQVRTGQIVVLTTGIYTIIKRVAAAPGDQVPAELGTAWEDRVPPGRLVLLGDNPSESSDSRQQGYYDGAHLVGVAVRPLWRGST